MFNPAITAIYKATGVPSYDGNPLIESLPPIADSLTGIKSLKLSTSFGPDALQKPRSLRSHMIAQICNEFFQPLSQHSLLYEKISVMIRSGYVGRNPHTGELQLHLQNGYERLQTGELDSVRFSEAKSTAQSMLLIGVSGCGKSTSLDHILGGYPQVIYHKNLNLNQVVYLKINCPIDGSLKELCLNFLSALDKATGQSFLKQYGYKRHTTETLLTIMSQLANSLAIGLLVIDEIQNLSRAKSGGSQKMLSFFVTLVNTIGVPVLFSRNSKSS